MSDHIRQQLHDAEVQGFVLGHEYADHLHREELQCQYLLGYRDGRRAYWQRVVRRVRRVLVCLWR